MSLGLGVVRFLTAVASFARRADNDDCEEEEEVGVEEEEEASFFLPVTINAVAKRAEPLVELHDKLPLQVLAFLFNELKKGSAAACASITRATMTSVAANMPWLKREKQWALICLPARWLFYLPMHQCLKRKKDPPLQEEDC